LQICPFSGKFFVATYQGAFQLFGRRNEVMWVKKPKHSHPDETEEGAWDVKSMGLGALDVELLFPEEFPVEEEPSFMAEGLMDDIKPDFKPVPHVGLSNVEGNMAEMTQQGAASDVMQIS
jgi:hypothetical protein